MLVKLVEENMVRSGGEVDYQRKFSRFSTVVCSFGHVTESSEECCKRVLFLLVSPTRPVYCLEMVPRALTDR